MPESAFSSGGVPGDVVERLRQAILQDELWALAASAPPYPDRQPTVAGGVHWTWATGEQWEHVTPDPLREYVGTDEGSEPVVLVTVEEWPLSWHTVEHPATHPHKVCESEEMRTGDAAHIARHDPARVLRTVRAHRKIIERYETAQIARDAAVDTPLAGVTRMSLRIRAEAVADLVSIYFPEDTPNEH